MGLSNIISPKKGPDPPGPFLHRQSIFVSAIHIAAVLAGAAALTLVGLLLSLLPALLALLLSRLLAGFLLILAFLLLTLLARLLARLVVLVHAFLRGWVLLQPIARTGFASPWFRMIHEFLRFLCSLLTFA